MQTSSASASNGLSRRTFLKGAAAAAVVAGSSTAAAGLAQALAPREAFADETAGERKVMSFCRTNCGSGSCSLDLTVRDGNIVHIEPGILPDGLDDPEKGCTRTCQRGLSNLYREYHPDRIKYPMRRVEGTERGAGQWEQISWDEAIEEICTKWKGYVDQYGKESVAVWTTFGNHGLLNGENSSAWNRLICYTGFSAISTGADWAGMYTPGFHIGNLNAGTVVSGIPGNAKQYIAWGANPAESYPHEWRYICDARDKGCTFTVVDPRVSAAAAKADHHFALRPGSDTALLMGIAKYYIDNDLCDKTFLKSMSDAPYLVRSDTKQYLRTVDAGIGISEVEAVAGRNDREYAVWDNATNSCVPASEATDPALNGTRTINGIECTTVFDLFVDCIKEWTLEHTAEVVDLTVDQIVQLADIINDGPTVLQPGYGFGHMTNAPAGNSMTCIVLILTGNFGKLGCGIGPAPCMNWAHSDMYGFPEASDAIVTPSGAVIYPEGFVSPRGRTISQLKLAEVVDNHMGNGAPMELKSIIFHASNAVGNSPDRQEILRCLDKVEFIVSVELFVTDTSSYADIILPCSFWFEEEDFYNVWQHPYIYYGEQVIDPLYESKPDFEIVRLLGEGMGVGEYFKDDALTVIKQMIDDSTGTDYKGDKISFERFKKEGRIRIVSDDYYDGANGDFGTGTGRLQIYIESPAPRIPWAEFNPDDYHLPKFAAPMEAWQETVGGYPASPLAEKYPLIFFSMHNRWRTHTSFGNVKWLRELQPEPVISINPIDAEARGIKEGDMVRAFNDRGHLVIRARLDAAMRPGTVNVPHGWQADQFVEGHYADLTNGETDLWSSNDSYYDTLCEVEKYEVK